MRTLPTFLLLCLIVGAATHAAAGEETVITYRGTVHVERRGDAVSAITITGGAVSYSIVLNEQARILAGYHGRRVEVTGVVVKVGGEERLRVTNVRLLQ